MVFEGGGTGVKNEDEAEFVVVELVVTAGEAEGDVVNASFGLRG